MSVAKLNLNEKKGEARQIKFRIAFSTGSDPEFPAEELNIHSPQTKGWQSPPFCPYPQEIGLALIPGLVQLSQLQILSHESKIATKIDVYVGTGDSYESCDFKRLGHLSLDENERSEFAARELKSVFVGKQGQFLKLCIHKCHLNRHNIYNQVGIIAINVLGIPVEAGSKRIPKISVVPARAKHIAPTEDLAFDMNFDNETAAKIREIHQAKEAAVASEEYELAKELKNAEDHLKHVGVKLAQLEEMKKQAVDHEDYDQAAMIKREIKAMRDEIDHETAHLLSGQRSFGKSSQQDRQQVQPQQQFQPQQQYQQQQQFQQQQFQPQQQQYFPPAQQQYIPPARQQYIPPAQHQFVQEDERPLPVLEHKINGSPTGSIRGTARSDLLPNEDEEQVPVDPEIIEEALRDVPGLEDLPEAESLPNSLMSDVRVLIQVFGEYLVRCMYSRQVRLRNAALTKIEMSIGSYQMDDPTVFSAFCSVIQTSTTDKVANVFVQGVKILELASEKADIGGVLKRHDIIPHIEPLMPSIVERLGNNASRIRDCSSSVLLHLARLKTVGPGFVSTFVLKLLRPGKTMLWRPLLGRLKLIASLLQELGIGDDRGLTLEPIMQLLLVNDALMNPNADVRECAKDVVMQMYDKVGDTVLPYLKDLRPKQMEEYESGFDQIDQKQGKAPRARDISDKGKPTARNSARSPGGSEKSPVRGERQSTSPKIGDFKNIKVAGDVNTEDEDEPFTCQFCCRKDPSFTEDALDMHYWRECPMLSSCPQCEQVIEVSMMNDHLLNECENKDNHKACPRCSEAVHDHHYAQHVKRGNCLPAKPLKQANRCPLCHKDTKPGVNGWKTHLLSSSGCPKNPRTSTL